MKNTIGQSICITLFGESHGREIGCVIDGIAPGIAVDENYIASRLSLRRPSGLISTQRHEPDEFRIATAEHAARRYAYSYRTPTHAHPITKAATTSPVPVTPIIPRAKNITAMRTFAAADISAAE